MIVIKDQNVRSIITAVAELMIIVVIVLFVGGPLNKYSTKLKTDLDVKRQELNDARNLVRLIPNPRKEIDNIKESMNELHDKSVSREELPRIIQQLINKSSELEIEIISIKPREDLKTVNGNLPQGVGKAYIEMIVRCPYAVLGDYLKGLDDLAIIFTLEDVRVERVGDMDVGSRIREGGEDDILATLILSTYTIWKF